MKKLAWIGMIVAALVILVLGIGAVTKVIFGNRYAAEIAAIRAKGEPVTPAELMGKPIPDAENGAVVYKKVFALIEGGKYDGPLKTLDRFGGLTSSDPRLVAEARRALPQVKPILNLVEEAAARPECRFQRDWSTGALTVFPEFARLRSISRLICSAAVLSARDGSMSESSRYIELGFRHSDSVRDEPAIMSLLVRQAMSVITSRAMKECLKFGDMSEEQARRLFDILGKADPDGAYIRALEGERVSWLSEMATSPGDLAAYCVVPDRYQGNVLFGPVSRVLGFGYRRVLNEGDEAAWLHFMAEQIEGAGLDYGKAHSEGFFTNRSDWPIYAPIGRLGGDNYGSFQFMRFRNKARTAMDQMLLVLQAYKARFGGYPASIQELKTRLGWNLPKDPFSGKDFIYKRQTKGFILYSVGPDMKDDGGRQVPNNRPNQDSKGDVVLKWDK